MRHITFIILSIVCFLGCTSKSGTNSNTVKIVCTTNIIGNAIQNIVPPNFEIKTLMGPGVDPHSYKSTTNDLKAMSAADIIIYNGLHLEMNLISALEELSKTKLVINMGETINPKALITVSESSSVPDPHFWHDVDLFSIAVQNTALEIANKHPQYKSYIDSASNTYKLKLDTLTKWVKTNIDKIAKAKRIMITAHDAFNYYGKAYKLEVIGVQGISTASDISVRGITDLTQKIIDLKIPAIFMENSVSRKNINAVIEGCKAQGLNLKEGGVLFSDGLGDKNSNADTYIKMIKHNTTTIVKALTND